MKVGGKKEGKSTLRLLFLCLLPSYFKYKGLLKFVSHPPSVYIYSQRVVTTAGGKCVGVWGGVVIGG